MDQEPTQPQDGSVPTFDQLQHEEEERRVQELSKKVALAVYRDMGRNPHMLPFFAKTNEERLVIAPIAHEIIELMKKENVTYLEAQYIFKEVVTIPLQHLVNLVSNSLNTFRDQATAHLFGRDLDTNITVADVYRVLEEKKKHGTDTAGKTPA